MEPSKNSNDSNRHRIAAEEIKRFEKLIEGHRNLLAAIGDL